MSKRFVVARHCFAGIGDHLSCLIGSWWVAQRTGRTLVIDWRGSRFNDDPSLESNCFERHFERRSSLGGVEVISDDRVAGIEFPEPIFPEKWTAAILATPDHMKHTVVEGTTINRLVTSDDDRAEPTVVLNQDVCPLPSADAVRPLLSDLVASEPIRREAQGFWDARVGPARAVAIHVRHGNGENVGLRASYWLGPVALIRQLRLNARNDIHRSGLSGRFADNAAPSLVGVPGQADTERRFYRRIAREFRLMADRSNFGNAVPILFCDSDQVMEGLSRALPGLVALPKRLLRRGDGPLHQLDPSTVQLSAHGGIRSRGLSGDLIREMLVELELMRRCSGLIYMDSGFSLLSRLSLESRHQSRLRPTLLKRLIIRAMHR